MRTSNFQRKLTKICRTSCFVAATHPNSSNFLLSMSLFSNFQVTAKNSKLSVSVSIETDGLGVRIKFRNPGMRLHLVNIKLEATRVIEEELRAKVAELREQLKQCATEKRKALHRSAEANRALEAQLKTARKEASKSTFACIREQVSRDETMFRFMPFSVLTA